jgi:hypothetical protein
MNREKQPFLFPEMESPHLPDDVKPEARRPEDKDSVDNKPKFENLRAGCQYCENVGPCMYCKRGQKFIRDMRDESQRRSG